ncbi:uncharacterized protein LOC123702492 isoform X2 [Colias croceus]|uniref:uncharacterized protein LOC123702492 isoform X2 n=1 Tax=Colias crocea TaxID=72248 RepID=UPI001E27FDEB|nr:uncharacterized protein LOC123702492 isoform X2 [Colias croceus]
MDGEDQDVMFTQLLNKRRKLVNLRNLINSRSKEAKASDTGASVPDPGQEFSDYDSDDSVKDKTYEPHEDLSDGSYVSGSPEKVLALSTYLKVKRKLSFSEKSPERQAKVRNNEDINLITLDDLLSPRKNIISATSVFNESPKENDRCFAATAQQTILSVYPSVNNLNESSLFDQDSSKSTNSNNMMLIQVRASTSAYKNDHIENRNLTDRDHTTGFLIVPHFDESVNISDTTMNEDIVNSNRIMVADKNGNVYIPDDRQIRNNENIQQIGTAVPSKSNTRKKVKNVTKWKRVAAKIARLKGSPYHSTVAKKKP